MEPTPELIEQLRRDKIEAAKRMTPEQKLAAGAELFDMACEVALAGIRMQHPGISDEAAGQKLRDRLAILWRQEIEQ